MKLIIGLDVHRKGPSMGLKTRLNTMHKHLAIAILVLSGFLDSFATTFREDKVDDPLSGDSAGCTCNSINSWGTYIYNWTSKYDLVFWPYTSEQFIWFCLQSGYISFGNDFNRIRKKNRSAIEGFLKDSAPLKYEAMSHDEKLDWLEKVYKRRNKGDDFWLFFYRLRAYVSSDEQRKETYYRKVLELLDKQSPFRRLGTRNKLQYYYILGEYNRRLGNAEIGYKYLTKVIRLPALEPWNLLRRNGYREMACSRRSLIKGDSTECMNKLYGNIFSIAGGVPEILTFKYDREFGSFSFGLSAGLIAYGFSSLKGSGDTTKAIHDAYINPTVSIGYQIPGLPFVERVGLLTFLETAFTGEFTQRTRPTEEWVYKGFRITPRYTVRFPKLFYEDTYSFSLGISVQYVSDESVRNFDKRGHVRILPGMAISVGLRY